MTDIDTPDPNAAPPVIAGAKPTAMDDFWLSTVRDSAKGSVAALEDAAKQLVTITSLSQTLYFAAISFSDLKKSLSLMSADNAVLDAIVFVLPVILWVVSLGCAVAVFKPRVYPVDLESPDDARDTFNAMVDYKHASLKRAHAWLRAGFVALIADIFLYLVALPLPPASK